MTKREKHDNIKAATKIMKYKKARRGIYRGTNKKKRSE